MTHHDLEGRLAQALSRTAPNDLDGVLSRCEARKGNVIQMTKKKKNPVFRHLIAACLALAIVGGSGAVYQQAHAVASVVSLDVNPSIELEVNKKEKVLACKGLNAEAQEVLRDMNGGADLEGIKLDVAVNAIVGALVRSGYLDSISSAILISVEDRDPDRAAQLQRELTAAVDVVLQEQSAAASVLSQTVAKDAALEQQARENNISTGKAALIERVLAQNSAFRFEDLSALSVEELKDMAETRASALPIGRDAALQKALAHAGVSANDVKYSEVDAELDDQPAHYDVELHVGSGEYEYEIDAYAGSVLRGKADILSGGSPAASAPVVVPSAPAAQPAPSKQEAPAKSEPPQAASAGDIGKEQAKAAALAHAGLAESQVSRLEVARDRDDGRLEYEVDFKAGGLEYEYTIDAASGAVLEHERDRDD